MGWAFIGFLVACFVFCMVIQGLVAGAIGASIVASGDERKEEN